MANIFAPKNKPSLFPMAFPTPTIPQHDYHLFYQQERFLFKFLCIFLRLEIIEATLIVGFLLWLEREGFTTCSLVEMIIHNFNSDISNLVVNQIITCIRLLHMKRNNLRCETSDDEILMLQSMLNRRIIHLEELYYNGDVIFQEVSGIGTDLLDKAFDDLLENANLGYQVPIGQPQREMSVGNFVGGLGYTNQVAGFNQDAQFVQNYVMAQQYQQMQAAALGGAAVSPNLVPPTTDLWQPTDFGQSSNQVYVGSHVVPLVREREEDPDDRTIFLTFSKGYPIPMNEVVEYLTGIFGDFVESTHMQEVEGDDQPLYARIVARHPAMMKAVVERDGPHGKSKYNINGKHVWARKFVPRPSSKGSAEF